MNMEMFPILQQNLSKKQVSHELSRCCYGNAMRQHGTFNLITVLFLLIVFSFIIIMCKQIQQPVYQVKVKPAKKKCPKCRTADSPLWESYDLDSYSRFTLQLRSTRLQTIKACVDSRSSSMKMILIEMKTPERSRTSRVGYFLVLSPKNSLCDVIIIKVIGKTVWAGEC